MKKGQLTVYIILGILLMLILALGYYLYQQQVKAPFEEPLSRFPQVAPGTAGFIDPEPVVSYCFEKLGREAVYTLAKQSGYVNPKGDYRYGEPGDYLSSHYYSDDAVVPYAVNIGESNMRSFDDILKFLERYVAVHADECMNFSSAEQAGVIVHKPSIDWVGIDFDWNKAVVNYSSEKVSFKFTPRTEADDLILSATYPVKLESREFSKESSDVQVIVPLRLQKLHSFASILASEIAKESDKFNITTQCSILSAADKSINIYASTNTYRKSHLVTIVDSKPVEMGLAPLRFQFAVRNIAVFGRCVG